MANQLLNKWTFDHCGKGILILMAKDTKNFWVAKNSKVPVDGKVFTDIFGQQVRFLIKEMSLYFRNLNLPKEISTKA